MILCWWIGSQNENILLETQTWATYKYYLISHVFVMSKAKNRKQYNLECKPFINSLSCSHRKQNQFNWMRKQRWLHSQQGQTRTRGLSSLIYKRQNITTMPQQLVQQWIVRLDNRQRQNYLHRYDAFSFPDWIDGRVLKFSKYIYM